MLPYATAGREMANLVLKPQVTAFLDVVTTATAAPTSTSRRSRSRARPARPGKTIRELRIRHETGAMIVALRKHGRHFDTTPEAGRRARATGDVLIAVGTPDELAGPRGPVRARREPVAG